MRAELEEPGALVGEASKILLSVMVDIKEDAWYGIFGKVENPKAVVFVALGDEAKDFLAWLKRRGGLDEPPIRTEFGGLA